MAVINEHIFSLQFPYKFWRPWSNLSLGIGRETEEAFNKFCLTCEYRQRPEYLYEHDVNMNRKPIMMDRTTPEAWQFPA